MAMKLSAFNKLKKTMMMTTSPNDNEALAALRIANKVIQEEGYTWNDVFHRLVKVEDQIESMEAVESTSSYDNAEVTNQAEVIRDAFEELGRLNYKSNFITSLAEQWEDRKWLSGPQQEALFKTLRTMKSKR